VSAPLILNAEGTYQIADEKGIYTVREGQLFLSEEIFRGIGRLYPGHQIIFEFEYRGWPHKIVYQREERATLAPSGSPKIKAPSGAPPTPPNSTKYNVPSGPKTALLSSTSSKAPSDAPSAPLSPANAKAATDKVPVNITIKFPASDGPVGWIESVYLLPEGPSAEQGYEARARTDGKQTVDASLAEVRTGRVYKLLVGYGYYRLAAGAVDLRNITEPVNLTMDAKLSN
jgi:hypothetical protein